MVTIYGSDSFKSGTSISDLLLGRWNSTGGTAPAVFSAGNGRFGGQSLRLGATYGTIGFYRKSGVGNNATMSLHFPAKVSILPSAPTEIASFMDGATVQLSLVLNATGTLSIYRGGSGGTLLATSSAGILTNLYYVYELKVTFATGTGGTIELRVWGPGFSSTGEAITSTGSLNTSASGNAYANGYNVGTITNSSQPNSFIVDYEHFVCLSDFVGDKRFFTNVPNGTLSTHWTPNASTNLSQIDEAQEDGDTTYNYSSTPGQVDLFTFPATIAGLQNIIAVIISLWARKDDAGARQVTSEISSSGVTANGATVNVSTTYAEQLDVFYNDPNTSSAWLKAGVDAMAAGYEEVA